MKKLLKTINCICLSGLVVLGAARNADAFFMKPPMPWDLEIDLPGNAGKLVSEAKALVMQAKTIKSQFHTQMLDFISGKQLKSAFKNALIKNAKSKKSPGKGVATGNIDGTELNADTSSEVDYFDVYHKLFFMPPSAENFAESYGMNKEFGVEGYQILEAAYKNKAAEYRQDVAVDTYFTGLMTERYLSLVEKTLERLEKCQNSIEKGNCTFFGLEMEEIPSVENPEELGEDNPGLLAQMKNAYIVSTIYDRLMRIVEDLVATEAIFQASRQIEIVKKFGTNESNAEKYIPQRYNFASKDSNEKIYAKSILIDKKQSECFNGGADCPKYNSKQAELTNMDDAKIMKDLAPIAEALNLSRNFHNQKNQMASYKTKYRQYLIAKIIHERAYNALENSERCAKAFFENYKTEGTELVWGTPGKCNEHEKREEWSLSRLLIDEYGKRTMNKIIGTDPDCDGYYESCPQGYTQKKEEHCIVLDENENIIRERKDLHPCIVETIADDKDIVISDDDNSLEDLNENKSVVDQESENKAYNDSDSLKDASATEDLNLGSRITTETPWQIGSELLMKLVKNKEMAFKPWNDQKSFQEEYLRQKYRNIEMIIKSIDRAVKSYQLATDAVNEENPLYEERDKKTSADLSEMLNAIAHCLPISEAINLAKEEFCTGTEEEESCNVYESPNERGIIIGEREVKYIDADGVEKTVAEAPREWNQKISLNNTCYFSVDNEMKNLTIKDKNTNKCDTSGWDLSVGYLVRSYYNKYLGNCAGTTKAKAKKLYKEAKERGRIVAQDKLSEVIMKRTSEDNNMQKIIASHEKEIASLKKEMEENKLRMNRYNEEIDKAARKKNTAQNALALSEQRVKSIAVELGQLKEREKVKEKTDKDEYNSCSFEYQTMKLQYEMDEIIKDKNENRTQWTCPVSCEKAEQKGIEICQKVADSHLIPMATYEIYLAKESQKDSPIKVVVDSTKFVNIIEAKEIIKKQEAYIESYKQRRNLIKDAIATLENKIREKTEDFADEYIEEATKSQKVIEDANEEFEDFMKEDEKRMENKERRGKCIRKIPIFGCTKYANATYENDDLETTITQVLEKNDNFKEAVKARINEEIVGKINGDTIVKALQENLGIPLPVSFVVDETFEKFGGINPGVLTAIELVNKVKEAIVDAATDIVTEQARKADEAITNAQENAIIEVEKIIGNEGLGICEKCVASPKQKENLSDQKYYEEKVLPTHINLIEDLKKKEEELGIDMFGIPDDAETVDGEYFVGLPARGSDYIDVSDADKNAGRDYKAPKEPLISLPPVREVFYYSAQDYEDTPKSGKRKKKNLYTPAIPHLLNKKYPGVADAYAKDWEYLPEIWRYLLARPNLREDRKYQQTFVERSFDADRLKNILDKNDGDYGTIMARGSTYPCRLGDSIIDVEGISSGPEKKIREIKFVKRDKKPNEFNTIQNCLDINLYNQRPCNIYGASKNNTICHMLSNHGPKENGSKKNPNYIDYQSISLTENKKGMFSDYSELGILLQKELKYRATQQWVNEYLLSEDSSYMENDIHRQKAEHATFTHNVWGSFLETVNAEYNARKSLEKITEEVKTSFEGLCKTMRESGKSLSGEKIPENCDAKCMQKYNEECAEKMLKNFASSPEDRDYGTENEYTDRDGKYNGIDCSQPTPGKMYEYIFCSLDALKEEKLALAREGSDKDPKQLGLIDPDDLEKTYSVAEKEKVKEYLINLMKEMAALEADKDEVTFIPADVDVDITIDNMENLDDAYKKIEKKMNEEDGTMKTNIKNAKTNRTIARENDDLAISSMENQSQIVPFCPFYIDNKNSGF